MKVGIIADTHGNLDGWRKALEVIGDSDIIFHCGDLLYHGPRFAPAEGYDPKGLAEALNACPVPLMICRGNGDSEVDGLFIHAPIMAPYAFAQLEGVRFLATHGHLEPMEKTIELARSWQVDFLLTAHLHVAGIVRHGQLTHINPGTTTYPLAEESELAVPTCAAVEGGTVIVYNLETGMPLDV